MLPLFCNLPMKQELYSVVAVKLNDEQIFQVAREVDDETQVWECDPREWKTLDGFIGFQIGKAMHMYQLDPVQIQTLVRLVYHLQAQRVTAD